MNIKRPLMPGWLQSAEQKLLLNKPGIWSTRIHLVLYYGILFILFLALLSFFEPVDVRDDSTTEAWIGFVSIISVIGLTLWLIYLLRFNVFKKYGIIHPLYGLITFIIYFIATGIIVLFTYVHPFVESVRANRAYEGEEIVRDVNAINLKINQLEHKYFRQRWDYDTVAIVPDQQLIKANDYEEEFEESAGHFAARQRIAFLRLDSTLFRNRLDRTDSVVKLNDTLYLMYTTPTFTFVSSYSADDYTKQKMLGSFEIFHEVQKHPTTPDESAAIKKELGVLLQKYRFPDTWAEGPVIETDDKPFEIIHKKYQASNINNSITNIFQKKYRWEKDLPGYLLLFFYVTLGIALLVFIFRHSTIRTFFITLLTAVLLTLFTAFVLAFTHARNPTFFAWMTIYCVLFFLVSLLVWSNKKRKLVTGIGINLFVFLVPVFPLMVFGWYYNWKRQKAWEQDIPFEYPDLPLHIFYAEIGGVLLLLVLLSFYINRIYRRWYALPED